MFQTCHVLSVFYPVLSFQKGKELIVIYIMASIKNFIDLQIHIPSLIYFNRQNLNRLIINNFQELLEINRLIINKCCHLPNLNQSHQMLIITLLFNFLFIIIQGRRRYRAGGRAAGIGRVTKAFGNGVATLIKDIKQGNFGEEDYPEFDYKKDNRFINDGRHAESMGTDTTFYVIVGIVVVVIVGIFLYVILKVLPKLQERSAVEDMKKRNNQRFKHYEAVKMIAETGIHPDKAFGRLQRIQYREKKKQ